MRTCPVKGAVAGLGRGRAKHLLRPLLAKPCRHLLLSPVRNLRYHLRFLVRNLRPRPNHDQAREMDASSVLVVQVGTDLNEAMNTIMVLMTMMTVMMILGSCTILVMVM